LTAGLLAAELVQGRPAHSYLLTGPDPGALRDAAKLIAQALNCLAAGPAGPCGQCVACREIDSGVFADLHMGEPRHKLADIKGQLALTVERPFVGRRRVVVLPNVPGMTREAQNALLKVLEEPPPSSVLILTAPSAEGILPTVVSRCRHIPVPGPTPSDVAADLRLAGFAADSASFAALAAGGDQAVAARLVARDDLDQLRRDAVNFVIGALVDPREPPLELIERHEARLSPGDEQADWFAAVRGVLRAAVAAGAGAGESSWLDPARTDDARIASLSPLAAAYLIEAIQGVEAATARHAAVRLALEAELLTMYDLLDTRR